MDGLLVIDKPAGPTSHDVVARTRRLLCERRIGHTGTLDPTATGVLPLVLGRATRLARFLSAAEKAYDATIRLGSSTDSGDSAGRPIGTPFDGPWPDRVAIDAALNEFRGTFVQQPPALSAKRIGGQRSYKLVRANAWAAAVAVDALEGPPLPAPVAVTARRIAIISIDDDRVTLQIDCSAGFYVRALAHDLGERLRTGAHLTALRRTRSGDVTVGDAVTLADIEDGEQGRKRALAAVVPLARMLPRVPVLSLTEEGARRAGHGRDLGPADFVDGAPGPFEAEGSPARFRLLDARGDLVALAEPAGTSGLLHPVVVLV
jgi:tRNA pseudouridine55 synthase